MGPKMGEYGKYIWYLALSLDLAFSSWDLLTLCFSKSPEMKVD